MTASSKQQSLIFKPVFMTGAAWLLFIVSPVMAELLSGSSPPVEFFNPLSLVFMTIAYGSTSVLLREFIVRKNITSWGKIWVGLVMGFYIEGLICKSYLSPQWHDFNFALGYGRFGGINVQWLISLEVYHALASFLIPLLIVEWLQPEQKRRPGLSQTALAIHSVLVTLVAITGLLKMEMNKAKEIYLPTLLEIIWMILPIVMILVTAKLIDSAFIRLRSRFNQPHPILVFIFGFASWVVFQGVISWEGPKHYLAPQAIMLQLTALAVISGIALIWSNRLGIWHTFALMAAHITFWSLIAIVQGLWPQQFSDNKSGMTLTGIAGLCLVIFLWFRTARLARGSFRSFGEQVNT